MSTYVLVHGLWHGKWCWEPLIPFLKDKHHSVYALDLPGRGENRFEYEAITFESIIQYLCNFIKNLNEPVILVGHSFAGLIIAHLADRYPQYIEKLIFIAGFLPVNNQSFLTMVASEKPTRFSQIFPTLTQSDKLDYPKKAMRKLFYHQLDMAHFEVIQNQFCAEPLNPLIFPVYINSGNFHSIEKSYIACRFDRAYPIGAQMAAIERYDIKFCILESDHSPFYSQPNNLAKLLY